MAHVLLDDVINKHDVPAQFRTRAAFRRLAQGTDSIPSLRMQADSYSVKHTMWPYALVQ
jgi:hypothetical protein